MASGESFDDALQKAQQAGYAEADPRDDIDAVDAGDKLCVLLRLAFDASCTPAQLHRQGIAGSTRKRPRLRSRARLRAEALAHRAAAPDKGVEARVHPTFLPSDHPLARVDGAYNALHVVGDLCGPVMFSGLGAGGDATASAVLADVVHVARRLALGDPVPLAAPERARDAAPSDGGGDDPLLFPPGGGRRARRLRADHPRPPTIASASPASSSASRDGWAQPKWCCSPTPRRRPRWRARRRSLRGCPPRGR